MRRILCFAQRIPAGPIVCRCRLVHLLVSSQLLLLVAVLSVPCEEICIHSLMLYVQGHPFLVFIQQVRHCKPSIASGQFEDVFLSNQALKCPLLRTKRTRGLPVSDAVQVCHCTNSPKREILKGLHWQVAWRHI